jgi:hypothetical protein
MSRTVAVVRWPVRASSRLSHRSSSSWRKGRRHQARTGGRNERPRVPSDATGPQFGQCPFNVTLTLRPATGWHQAWFLHRLTPRNTHYARVRKPSADPRVANGSAGLRQWVGDALQAAWTVFRGLEGYSHFVRPPNPPPSGSERPTVCAGSSEILRSLLTQYPYLLGKRKIRH